MCGWVRKEAAEREREREGRGRTCEILQRMFDWRFQTTEREKRFGDFWRFFFPRG